MLNDPGDGGRAPTTAHELKEAWLKRAPESAGIDRARWDPELGAEDNRRTIEAVYHYYARLYLDNPELKWAGLAAMIGPAFYAAFRDIGFFPNLARRSVLALSRRASARLLAWAGGDLGFYERTFLVMQKKIFEDAAPMHEAYLAGGVGEIERLCSARIIDVATLTAWKQIDAGHHGGDAALVDAATGRCCSESSTASSTASTSGCFATARRREPSSPTSRRSSEPRRCPVPTRTRSAIR